MAVLVTEAPSITIAAWSALCNMLLLGLESYEFLEIGLIFNRLLRSICVEWEAQVQKSQVPAPRATKRSLHSCIVTSALCTGDHDLLIHWYLMGSLYLNAKKEIHWRFETLLVGRKVGRKERLDLHFLNLLKCVQR